jgi:hypothetical protein
MKLADSWSEVVPTEAPSGQLYDESEESDEVDESKDGCGGVVAVCASQTLYEQRRAV